MSPPEEEKKLLSIRLRCKSMALDKSGKAGSRTERVAQWRQLYYGQLWLQVSSSFAREALVNEELRP